MLIQTTSQGKKTEHVIPEQVMCLVHDQGIKVTPLDADLVITPKTTVDCMTNMSQKAWEHISTGELFQYFFKMLFQDASYIPPTINEFLEDSDEGMIHGAGLIVQLVESRFAGLKKVFVQTPEAGLHPKVQYYLMSVIEGIKKIPCGQDPLIVEVGLA